MNNRKIVEKCTLRWSFDKKVLEKSKIFWEKAAVGSKLTLGWNYRADSGGRGCILSFKSQATEAELWKDNWTQLILVYEDKKTQ